MQYDTRDAANALNNFTQVHIETEPDMCDNEDLRVVSQVMESRSFCPSNFMTKNRVKQARLI